MSGGDQMQGRIPYPFSAIVGQEPMKTALLLNAVNPRLGGVLIRGEKGTAKSTAVRALAALLPEVDVVAGCPFGCNPADSGGLCSACSERASLPVARRRVRVVDLPVGATEDRVLGTLDIETAIRKGERRFEPGILAEANGGFLYVDEVNLLDDHLVDVLLDSAAMGRNMVEREGVSFSHPARFVLVGTMNPEEGELRPQLLDRFALCVSVEGIADVDARMEVVRRRAAYDDDREAFARSWQEADAALAVRITDARKVLPAVVIEDDMLRRIAETSLSLGVDGHRADIVMLQAARTLAALAGRDRVALDDVREASRMALPHRMRRKPFQKPGEDTAKLASLFGA
jgi:magnesium chelatase subunit I